MQDNNLLAQRDLRAEELSGRAGTLGGDVRVAARLKASEGLG